MLLTLVLGVGITSCDDVSSASSDIASSVALAEPRQDTGGGDPAGSGEVPAEESGEEPAAESMEDSSGWSDWLGGLDSGEGSESGANSESESQKKSKSVSELQKEFYTNCKETKAVGAAPMYEGDPDYHPELGYSHDGIACNK